MNVDIIKRATALGLQRLTCMLQRPCQLLQFVCAALPNAAVISSGETTGVQEHGLQALGRQCRHGRLNVCTVRQAQRADASVAPVLGQNPGQRIYAIETFVDVLGERALRPKPATAILNDVHVARARKLRGDLGFDFGYGFGLCTVAVVGFKLAVGCALQEHRQWSACIHRYVDICGPDSRRRASAPSTSRVIVTPSKSDRAGFGIALFTALTLECCTWPEHLGRQAGGSQTTRPNSRKPPAMNAKL